ncbi:site-specific integrase [Bacteroides uniformis]|uniref:site-specific integrase n=1 Tax=Bacteroides uniformis TaxID=820 RepID=UPI0032C00103
MSTISKNDYDFLVDTNDTKLQKTLDAFLFCCYAGMRYSDFISLSPDNIVKIRQETWLIYKSIKTSTEVRLPLYLLFEGKGLVILDKYRDDLQSFFHLRDNSNVNKDLIVISRLAGLSKKISFHTARHTNATLLIYNGVNITTVQKLLGHKSVKTTQVYTNVMDMTIVHDLEKNHALMPLPKKTRT